MHITIDTTSQFRDAFHAANRANQFSYEALGLLFEYFEEMDDSCELDVVAICCDYAESTVDELVEAYDIYLAKCCDDEDERKEIVLNYLENNTSIVGCVSDSIIYAQF